MPRRNAALPIVAVLTLGLGSTACEKQSPWVTITAGGVVVKARAAKYCRGTDCDTSTEKPLLKVKPGDTLGIDVPRSVSKQGWRLGQQGPFRHDHYFAFRLPDQLESGLEQTLVVVRDPKHGEAEWHFTIRVR